jgi:hypothetical protein
LDLFKILKQHVALCKNQGGNLSPDIVVKDIIPGTSLRP